MKCPKCKGEKILFIDGAMRVCPHCNTLAENTVKINDDKNENRTNNRK